MGMARKLAGIAASAALTATLAVVLGGPALAEPVVYDWYVTIPGQMALCSGSGDAQPGTYTGSMSVSYGGTIGENQTLSVTTSPTATLTDSKGWSGSAEACVSTTGLSGLTAADVASRQGGTVTVSADLAPGAWEGTCTFDIVLDGELQRDPVPDPNGVTFAVYSAQDNSLRFYKRDFAPKVGDTLNGLTVSAVYTGIETDSYNTATVPWNGNRPSIVSVSVEDNEIAPRYTTNWFNGCSKLTSLELSKLDTSKTLSVKATPG